MNIFKKWFCKPKKADIVFVPENHIVMWLALRDNDNNLVPNSLRWCFIENGNYQKNKNHYSFPFIVGFIKHSKDIYGLKKSNYDEDIKKCVISYEK